ncbi:NAD(P)-binding protein [Annulohypoxylon nitens]|nr:NAD(P)-binding protein [Annulohypoxylon nitens]
MSSKGSVLITSCRDAGAGSAMVIAFQSQGYRDIQAARDAVREETGGTLTFLINCAARNHFMQLLDEDIEAGKALYDTNVWGPLAVTQSFAPLLIKAKGTVVFITSLSGYLNVPYQGTFAATKRSEEIMAETLRLELAPFHVNVLSVVTGALKTRGQSHFDDWKLPEGSLYKPVESTISDRARGQEGAPRMEAADYAKRVVSEIIKGKTGKFCASAGVVNFGTTWLPTSLMHSGVKINTGLEVLAEQNK